MPRHVRPAVVVGIAGKRPGAAGVARVGLQGKLRQTGLGRLAQVARVFALAVEIAEQAVVPVVHRGDDVAAVANDPNQLPRSRSCSSSMKAVRVMFFSP